MRRIAIILCLLIMSSCFAGCAAMDENQQDQETNTPDNRPEMTGKVSLIDVYIDSNTEDSSDSNSSSSEVKVDSLLVIARLASGSLNVTISEISYYTACSRGELGNEQGLIVTGPLANSTPSELDDTPLTVESVLNAGQTFKFTVQLGDCAAADGDSLEMRVLVEGGGITIMELRLDGTTVGKSVG